MESAADRLSRLLDEGPDGEADALAVDLTRRFAGVRDATLLPELLRNFVDDCDDASLLAALLRLQARAAQGQAGPRRVMQALAIHAELFRALDYDRVTGLYTLAAELGLLDLATLFLSARQEAHRPPFERTSSNDHVPLPLGVRKQAARTRDRNLIDRLLRDRNPQVIGVLLNNPWILERDVVLIAALRPTHPDVLRAVAQHPRWSARYKVRKALACNPHTPTPLALRLLGTLLRQDLEFVVTTHALSDEVLAEAQRLLGG